MATEWGRM